MQWLLVLFPMKFIAFIDYNSNVESAARTSSDTVLWIIIWKSSILPWAHEWLAYNSVEQSLLLSAFVKPAYYSGDHSRLGQVPQRCSKDHQTLLLQDFTGFFTGWTLFLSHNQQWQYQSTDGRTVYSRER